MPEGRTDFVSQHGFPMHCAPGLRPHSGTLFSASLYDAPPPIGAVAAFPFWCVFHMPRLPARSCGNSLATPRPNRHLAAIRARARIALVVVSILNLMVIFDGRRKPIR